MQHGREAARSAGMPTRMPHTTPHNTQDLQTWRGHTLFGPGEEKIGEITDVYLDRQTHQPEWLAVKTGLFGSNLSFVPISEATRGEEGVNVPFEKAKGKDAPNVQPDGELSE